MAAKHKLEVAVDLVNEVTRMEEQEKADGVGSLYGDIKISAEQFKQLEKSFKTFDRNNDRTLDVHELGAVFRVMGQNPTKKQLDSIAKEADLDGNGRIDEKEFIKLLKKHMQSDDDVQKELREAFKVFDRKKDGRVYQTELMYILQQCGEPLSQNEAEELMVAMDTDKNGYIDIDEFVAFLCKPVSGKNTPGKSTRK